MQTCKEAHKETLHGFLDTVARVKSLTNLFAFPIALIPKGKV